MPPVPILKNYAPQIDQFTKNSGVSVENIRKTSTKFWPTNLVPAQFQNFQFTGLLLSFPIPVPLRLSQAADETQYAGHRGDGYALRSKIDVKALPWRLQDASSHGMHFVTRMIWHFKAWKSQRNLHLPLLVGGGTRQIHIAARLSHVWVGDVLPGLSGSWPLLSLKKQLLYYSPPNTMEP